MQRFSKTGLYLYKSGYLYRDTQGHYARTDKHIVRAQEQTHVLDSKSSSPTTTTPTSVQKSERSPTTAPVGGETLEDDEWIEYEPEPASIEQCLRFYEIKRRVPHIVAVHVLQLNALDASRPKDSNLVDSGAECNVFNDLRKCVSRISDTDSAITFADGTDTMRCEGIGTVRDWYYDWRGHVFVDEYTAYYCPGTRYPIRSEQELCKHGLENNQESNQRGGRC